jgi:pyruvate/2-oxoglutarate dehydrogenase complex dihydrolipoamide dehydrogenase (E3) component
MTPVEEYDLVILGTGEGAKYLAWTLAKEGQRVAVVERKYVAVDSDRILGFTAFGVDAGEIMGAAQTRGARRPLLQRPLGPRGPVTNP